MKLARNVFFGLVVLGATVFLSGVSFAQTAPAAGKDSSLWKAKHRARAQLFKDAAAALQQTRPDLAKGLEEMTVATHKTEMQKMTEEKNEKEEPGEKVEPKSEQGEKK